MADLDLSPLNDLDESSLYALLGDAWYAQLKTVAGEGYYFPSNYDVGKREFEAVLSLLSEALRQPDYQGATARVASLLHVQATWKMPVLVVIALARHRGLIAIKADQQRVTKSDFAGAVAE